MLKRRHKLYIWASAGLLAVAAAGGYLGDWRWTGFHGNSLWDWLHLLMLPVALAVFPVWHRTHAQNEQWWRTVFAAVIVVFAVLVFGGYVLRWSWTGFRGNTLWDWINLLIVPFVLPLTLSQLSANLETDAPRESRSSSSVASPRDAAGPQPL